MQTISRGTVQPCMAVQTHCRRMTSCMRHMATPVLKYCGLVRRRSPGWDDPVHQVLTKPRGGPLLKKPKLNPHQSLEIGESPAEPWPSK